MRKLLLTASCFGLALLARVETSAQISLLQDYSNFTSAPIGTYQGISFREAGFSGLYPIPGTNGKEFWTCSDRGVNIDAASANPSACRPTYDKIFVFPSYAPKIHRIRINGDSVQILRTITIKRPSGTNATGVLNPDGFGSTTAEVASTDTVLNCANFNSKTTAKDIWSIDAEGIIVDKEGNFWICEENGTTIWKLNQNGVVIKRFTPYANLAGAQPQDAQIDTVFKYRKNNRGFEGITIAPNGKIYAIIQSPILYPNVTVGEATRVHRILEINPATNAMRMLAYLNDGIIGSGSNQVRLKDWKIGDMAAINDSTFLVIEAALRGTTDIKRVYKININGATAVTSGLYAGQTLEALVDSAGLAAQGIVPVKKTLFMDLLANNWPSVLEKAEGMAIVDDSTVVFCNDNDYGQVSPSENGIATATGILTHLMAYRLQGSNKLQNFDFIGTTYSQGRTAQSSSQAPYLTPAQPGVHYTSILSVGDVVNGYKFVGLPDGLGAFDNGDGTFTVVSNHEFGNTSGATHAYGSKGAFVSKWIIKKSDFTVLSGSDLTHHVKLYNPVTQSYTTYSAASPSASAAFSRFCSADLPAVSAFYNSNTGKGTMERIFMDGEENGNEGRAMAHIVTGLEAGYSYELPYLGKFSWENSVACPYESDSTIVVGTDDATPGQVYVYVGAKSATGSEIEKAGLSGGKLFGVKVTGMVTESNGSVPAANTPFTLFDLGQVNTMTGAAINTNSNNGGVTTFLRPEDAVWDPANPNDLYFATTNAFNANTRLWKVHFTNIANPSLGGTITAVLDGSEGGQMYDNIGLDNYGHVMLVEDVGGNAHLGKTWQYTIATDQLKQVGSHDSTRFLNGSANFLTQDEEATGIIDMQHILGPGWFLVNDQAHYGISGDLVEGGQMLAMFNPDTYNANPEMDLRGNNISIANNDMTPGVADNTDFSYVNTNSTQTKTFAIHNAGPGALIVSGITFTGANASEFTLATPPSFPVTIAANSSQNITVQFAPLADGIRTAEIFIANNDFDEKTYKVALKGQGASPEVNLTGNGQDIADGSTAPALSNGTDFGDVYVGFPQTRAYIIHNTGLGILTVNNIAVSGANAGEFTLVNPPSFPLAIQSSGTQVINVKFTPTVDGVRTATLTVTNDDANEGTYDYALKANAKYQSGIEEAAVLSSLNLYPNPAANTTTVSMKLKHAMQVEVAVVDLQGKQVMSYTKALDTGENNVVLNTAALAEGVYFVQVTAGEETAKIKLVVMH